MAPIAARGPRAFARVSSHSSRASLRQVIPLMPDAEPAPVAADQTLAAEFLRTHSAQEFRTGGRP